MSRIKHGGYGVKKRRRMPLPVKILLTLFIILSVLAASAAAIFAVNYYYVNKNFTVSFYQINSDKVSDNIRIIELADLHNSEYGEKNSDLVERIRSLRPDLIIYAGDMINEGEDDYSILFDLSDQLSEIAPIYACYGNHELDQYLFHDKQFTEKLEEHNVQLLSNEATEITVKNSVIQLIAVSDNVKQFDVETNNAKKFLESLEPTGNCRICLTHYPELFKEKLLHRGIDVAFTGHAHGGHIRLPRIGGLFSYGEGFFPKFTAGVVQAKDGAQVVVSRGLGNHNAIPRINNQPELVVVDICWY